MATSPDYSRLRTIFDVPGMRWIVERMEARMAVGRPLRGTLTGANAKVEERRALDNLLGRRSTTGAQLTVDLEVLATVLRGAGLIENLEEVVLACCGPVTNRRAEDEQRRESWRGVFDRARLRCGDCSALRCWVDAVADQGTLKRFSRGSPLEAERLLDGAFRVVGRSPGDEVLLANLAAACFGDSHALDRGQPVATLCLRAIKFMYGIDGLGGAEARREAWAAAGVIIDDLSAPVLTLNLCAASGTGLKQILDLHRQQGQPVFLTYRQLRAGADFSSTHPEMRIVYVCENPSVVSAAARELGSRCRPLVCTNGQPASAARLLLSHLRQAGIELRCHADFDWAGLQIIEQLVRDYAAVPWKMRVDDYRGHVGMIPLAPQGFMNNWSPELADALRETGKAVFEEQVMSPLLQDLGEENHKTNEYRL